MNRLTITILATAIVGTASFISFTSGVSARGLGNVQMANDILATSLVCSERGSARIERRLEPIAGRLDLTQEQTDAFDAFKSAALSAQSQFLRQCNALKLARNESGADMDLMDHMRNRQALLGARLQAASSVMPWLEAFYDNLSDGQKHLLRPRSPHDKSYPGMEMVSQPENPA